MTQDPTKRLLTEANGVVLAPAPLGSGQDDSAQLAAKLPILNLRNGQYTLNAGITVAQQSRIAGMGGADAFFFGALTDIVCTSKTNAAITLTAAGCILREFSLRNTSGLGGGDASKGIYSNIVAGKPNGATPGAAGGTRYRDVTVRGFVVNFESFKDFEWYMDGCFSYDAVIYGIKIDSNQYPDSGDQAISNCQVIAGPTNLTPGSGIRWEGGGGLKIVNTKVNNRNGSAGLTGTAATWGIGIDMHPTNGTGDLLIANTSVENWSNIGIRLNGQANVGQSNLELNGVQVAGYISSCTRAVEISTRVAGEQALKRAAINGGDFWVPATANAVLFLDGVQDLYVGGASLDNSKSTTAPYIWVGSSAKDVTIAKNNYAPGTAGSDTVVMQFDQPQTEGGQTDLTLSWKLPTLVQGTNKSVWKLPMQSQSSMLVEILLNCTINGSSAILMRQTRMMKWDGSGNVYVETEGTDHTVGPAGISITWDVTTTPGSMIIEAAWLAGTTSCVGSSTIRIVGGRPAKVIASN